MTTRERKLILTGNPCFINFFDRTLLTVKQARQRGPAYCLNYETCLEGGKNTYCAIKYSSLVSRYVVKGSTLRKELEEFLQECPFLDREFWNSLDRREFTKIKGKARILSAVEGAARVIMLQDPFESVFPRCEKCEGLKLPVVVIDTVRDGNFALSGSGKTIKRTVEYCPECEQEPRGGVVDGTKEDIDELKFWKELGKE
jgi:hypothetical protein